MTSGSRRRAKPGFKVFHGVSELGLGARLARTRRRLLLVTLGVTGIFLAYAVGTAGFMRSGSESVGLNVFLISGAMLLILVAAFVQAMAVGDLVFPGPWRERVILGRKAEAPEDADEETAIAHMKDHSVLFYALIGVLLMVNYGLYGAVTGGFLSEYHSWGYQHTLLRSDEPEAQVRGVRNVVNPRNAEAKQAEPVRGQLIGLAREATPEVRGWALWAIGTLQVFEAAPTLRGLVSNEREPEAVRARAAEALGRLADPDGALMMANMLGTSFGRGEITVGLLRGLGLARIAGTAPAISRLLDGGPSEIRAHAFWALGRSGNRSYRERLVGYLEEGRPEERCWAAEGLKFLADETDLVQAHTWFATVDETACEPVVWEAPYHWMDDEWFRFQVVVGETLAEKLLKVIFTAGGARERDFFATIALDPERPPRLRALARELALRIDHRR
jgi:HEAT repeat protein